MQNKNTQPNDSFNYQEWLESIKDETFKKFQNSELKFFKNKVFKNFVDHFYAQVALNNGASSNLPYKTLSLLGEKLSHPAFKDDFKKIINQNVIKSKGQYYKLDDQIYQKRIQKALKNYSFQECSEIKKAS